MIGTRALLVVLVALAGCAGTPVESPTPSPAATESPTATAVASPVPTTVTASTTPSATFVVGEPNVTVALDVADSPDERRRGLMNRTSLARNRGMVFVYAEAGPRTFWMKNTLVPLDMIFVDADGAVINVEHASVQPNASTSELRRYHSDGPARYVIEVNRGFANRTGVKPGTRVVFHGPRGLLTPEGYSFRPLPVRGTTTSASGSSVPRSR